MALEFDIIPGYKSQFTYRRKPVDSKLYVDGNIALYWRL